MELAPLRSPVTKRVQNSAGSKPGLAVYAEHSITSDFICVLRNTGGRVHLLSKIHKAPVVQWRSVA